MLTCVNYRPGFVANPNPIFDALWSELDWERRGSTPRREYYCNDVGVPYVYGRGAGVREYLPKAVHRALAALKGETEAALSTKFEVAFLNGYEDARDSLGWHADDSESMDDNRPIAILTLGAEREIWFCPNTDRTDVTKLVLENGSLCVMAPGMQDTHLHRIPKAGFECGPRISITFRGNVA
jgi:alkylated DNA repair dioxygenase AlkB